MELHNEIAKIALDLYEKSGRIEGRDLYNWLEAERIVMARYKYKEQQKLKAESPPSSKKEKASKTKKHKKN